MTKKEQQKMAELQVENWNLKYPIGTAVTLSMDCGLKLDTKTRSEAYIADCGIPVAFFENVSDYYLLDRAKVL